ncbi:DUF4118 domain-containing protein [Sphingomonas sp. ac-8]|uniref:DUF4118 domain-containing protein n=1 Tax=Sphingomonas sp. ac-8 TaxID=3242977 RepID=UPI003A804814
MVAHPSSVPAAATHSDSLAVLVSGSPGSEALVAAAERLAQSLGVPWEAVYVETPERDRTGSAGARAAEALGVAAQRGGRVATIAAATIADGILEHLKTSPATHLVLQRERPAGRGSSWRRSLVDQIAAQTEGVTLHVVPTDAADEADDASSPRVASGTPLRHYALAALPVVATLLLAELLQLLTGTRSLDLLFLFPVIAVAARLGFRPALLAALLSVFCYNYFLLAPSFRFDVRAPQNWVMAAVFLAVAGYTSSVTGRMRGRLRLSDRSARESASLAALAQRLTRDADWETTALTLCEHVHALFGLHTVVFRERDGALVTAAGMPAEPRLSPVDRAALDWSWAHGEPAGAGTEAVPAADWQFQPLQTSLGTLAVLGIAREDGRDPVRPDQRVLLSSITAQGALAHERLRLEDMMRAPPKAS